jgi:hypothetical protein
MHVLLEEPLLIFACLTMGLETKVEERVNAIVNRLNATKRDVPQPDLAGEKEAYEEEVEDLSGHPLHPKSRELKYLEQSQTLIC